jgi:hypothetical protein
MQRISRITLPALSIKRDFEPARRRLLADFPAVHDVLATTTPATLLVLYSGPAEADAWLAALLDSVATRPATATSECPSWCDGSRAGHDPAA